MASLGEDLRTFIVGSTAIASEFPDVAKTNAVEQNIYPSNPPNPRIWYRRAESETDRYLDSTPMVEDSVWDVEIIGTDDNTVVGLVDVVKEFLDGHRGTVGNRQVQGMFCENHDDDYDPRGVASEDGFTVAALRLRIFST